MNKQLSCIDAVRAFEQYKSMRSNAVISERIDKICDIIGMLDDEQLNRMESVKDFAEKINSNTMSRTDDAADILDAIYAELKNWLKDNLQPLKDKAIYTIRRKKKKKAVIAVVWMSCVAALVLVFGLLSAFGKIDAVVCNVLGVADCVFGICFFIYEFCDDKLKTSEVAALNEEQIDCGNIAVLSRNVNYGQQAFGGKNKFVQHIVNNNR